MRLISTLKDQKQAYTLSLFLQQKGIENQLELSTNKDWGSDEYGDVTCNIWIVNEDDLDTALTYAADFKENPDNPKFAVVEDKERMNSKTEPLGSQNNQNPSTKIQPAKPPMGAVTFYLLFLCAMLMIISNLTSPEVKSLSNAIPRMPVLSSPINKELMYDYPHAYEIIDQLVQTVGIEALDDINAVPEQGKKLLEEFAHTPYWQGLYDKVIQSIKLPNAPITFDAPLFEKIRKGEVWRLFTPALLHYDIFHIFFNMIWLVVLGQQMEQRLGKRRYLFFIVIAGVLSNTAQYLMSGSNFLGFSGVLCAMLAFIWVRQKKAGWEGYQLERSTLGFIAFFILFMFAFQIFSFLLEIYADTTLPIGIANTAHLTGAFVGYLLAQKSWFAWRRQ